MANCEDLITTNDLAAAKIYANKMTEFVESSNNTMTTPEGEDKLTITGMGDIAKETVSLAVSSAGYTIVGDFSDSSKVTITSDNQVYTSKLIAGSEDALWRTNQVLPYTPTGADPTSGAESGKWVAVAQGELKSIARSLNVLNTQVIYSTDTTTVLDDVLYIYDASEQITYAKPSDVGIGEVIVSVSVDGILETNVGNYKLINANPASNVGLGNLVGKNYIGNISNYIGQVLQEQHKDNIYEYPDASGKFYGPASGTTFPITIPADPAASGDWALVNALTADRVTAVFDNLASAISFAGISDGMTIKTLGRYTYDDFGGGHWRVVEASSVSPNMFDTFICSEDNALAITLIYEESTVINTLGAKMNMIDDDSPYIEYMARKLGVARCASIGLYENYALGNPLTYGVLIKSDVECTAFATYDFGGNQVKISDGASFTPQKQLPTSFTVNVVWKNFFVVDSAGQDFIRTDDGISVYQSCLIERVDINNLRSLIKSDGNFGWFNLCIRDIKTIRMENLYDVKDGTGQTGNSVVNGLFQSIGTLVKLENATAQCDFSNTNLGLNSLTEQSAIVRYVGTVLNASDKLSFTNCKFEYDDTDIDASILKTNADANMNFVFRDCGIFHKELIGMNARGFYPFNILGDNNKISFYGDTFEWWSRYSGAQGVLLKAPEGQVIACDLRQEMIDLAGNFDRAVNISSEVPMLDSDNVTFIASSYTVENNRLVVVFFGITKKTLVAGDVLYDFIGIPSFPHNIVHNGDYIVRLQASDGTLVARESIPIGDSVSGSIMVNLRA